MLPSTPEMAIDYPLAFAFCCSCGTGTLGSGASCLQGIAPQEAEVDRLYSRFPAGSVGLALLVLRLVDGLGLAGEGVHLFTPHGSSAEPVSALFFGLVLVASAILLILGLRTPLAGSAAAACTAGAA